MNEESKKIEKIEQEGKSELSEKDLDKVAGGARVNGELDNVVNQNNSGV